ncbi:MAG: hypothetical protein OJK14_10690 [Achromobacter sp.]|uniref:hypothetical protein n=1 Tax=Achromobacter sp. TaxID=134375 RepID=UPI002589EECE|nr:hypothetical protein [Achromobacter sp.]MCW0207556.1 hypothetical protein [Achromobacter sp.]
MRTATPAPFLPSVIKLAADARNTLAATLFNIEAVRLAVTQAAGLGRNRLFLRPTSPVDLRKTAAAQALLDHLAGVGLAVFWHPYTVDQGGRPETGYELEITWNEPA